MNSVRLRVDQVFGAGSVVVPWLATAAVDPGNCVAGGPQSDGPSTEERLRSAVQVVRRSPSDATLQPGE